jgi:hypothetical protein
MPHLSDQRASTIKSCACVRYALRHTSHILGAPCRMRAGKWLYSERQPELPAVQPGAINDANLSVQTKTTTSVPALCPCIHSMYTAPQRGAWPHTAKHCYADSTCAHAWQGRPAAFAGLPCKQRHCTLSSAGPWRVCAALPGLHANITGTAKLVTAHHHTPKTNQHHSQGSTALQRDTMPACDVTLAGRDPAAVLPFVCIHGNRELLSASIDT